MKLLTLLLLLSCGQVVAQKDTLTKISIIKTTFERHPCPTDTLKGILIWHSGEYFNHGNSWEHGYWVGKCGPFSIKVDGLTFVPGVAKFTDRVKYKGEKDYKPEERTYSHGAFYDGSWKKVSASRVYGFIILDKQEPEKNLGEAIKK